MSRQEELARCDREMSDARTLMHTVNAHWVLGMEDWRKEKGFIMQEFVTDAVRTEPTPADYVKIAARLQDPRTLRLLHVAMGLATEAGEFVDQLKRHIFYGKPIDTVNLIEELGDTSWYERIGCDVLEVTLVEMLERNVAKLKARFPDKFTAEKAVVRDLVAERVELEGKG